MQNNWTPDALIHFSGSYWGVCALHAAISLDVFTPLRDGPLSAAELAGRLGCAERGLSMLLTAMCALNLLTREGERFALPPFGRAYLCRGTDGYIGHIISHHRQLMPGWTRLDEAARTGQPTRGRVSFSPEEREPFLLGMYNMASVRAAQAVAALDLTGRARLLDLGGGPGAYAVRFCQANPDLQAVIFDQESTRPFAEQIVAQNGLAARIRFAGGNFFTDPLPTGFDVVWISHVLHGTGDAEARHLLRSALDCLNPGGLLLIQEFLLDDDRTGPEFAALFGLNMLVGTETGKVFTAEELVSLLCEIGACRIRRIPLASSDGSGLVAGEKTV